MRDGAKGSITTHHALLSTTFMVLILNKLMLHLQKDDNEKNDIAIIQRALQQLQSLQP